MPILSHGARSGEDFIDRPLNVILWSKQKQGFPSGSEGKVSACNAGDQSLIPGSGRSPGEGNGSPLQYSCLENPIDRGAWQATDHRVAKSRTGLNDFTFTFQQKQKILKRGGKTTQKNYTKKILMTCTRACMLVPMQGINSSLSLPISILGCISESCPKNSLG